MFARGAPEPDTDADPGPEQPDRVEFLWACIALFDGDWSKAALERPAVYAPQLPDLYTVEEARGRVRQRMRDAIPPALVSLADLLPAHERTRRLTAGEPPTARTRYRSAWTSTLMACLELAKQGELVAEQLEHARLPAFIAR